MTGNKKDVVFTIGHRESYDSGLAGRHGPAPFEKMGKCILPDGKPYGGGCIFQTFVDAEAYIKSCALVLSYAVYGVVASWDCDTEQLPGEPFRRLLRDAQIISAYCYRPGRKQSPKPL